MRDVFSDALELPKRVYILGSGINGLEHHSRIPKDAYVISLNRAVCAMPSSLWLMRSLEYAATGWFKDAMNLSVTKAFGYELAQRVKRADYFYRYMPKLYDQPKKNELVNGILRTGGTVAGCALQLCHWKGVRRAILCGVDMKGRTYWDGAKGSNRGTRSIGAPKTMNTDKEIGGVDMKWNRELDTLNHIVRVCSKRMVISSLSDTALKVDRV